jgi:hypothetical protein
MITAEKIADSFTSRACERYGLSVTRERVGIDSLVLPELLKTRFLKEYDTAVIKQLAKTILNGIITPHALVVKEVYGGDHTSQFELLHKPSFVFALQQCGISEADVVVIHANDDFDLYTASSNQLLFLGEQGVLTDHVVRDIPMEDVISDESIVDEEYRDVLQDQLSTGQLVNIRVRVRHLGKRIVYDIIDGYHRYGALNSIGAQLISARLTFGMTNEELFDERVLAAFRSAKAVKFARMITSMQLSYSESVWSKQFGLRLSQILSWAVNAKKIKQPGKNLGIPEDIARNAMEWVSRKAVLWNSDVGTLYAQIRAAEDSFPEIIKQIRTTEGGGHAGDGVLNRDKFIAMVEPLGKKLPLQLTMVAIVKEHNLNADQTRVVAGALALIEEQPELIRLVQFNPFDVEVLSSILKTKVTFEKGKFVVQDTKRSLRDRGGGEVIADTDNESFREDILEDGELFTDSQLAQLAPIDVSIEDARSDTIFRVPSDAPTPEEADASEILPDELKPAKPIGAVKDNTSYQDYDKARSSSDYEREITELQEALEKSNVQNMKGGKSKDAWYETLATLTPEERAAIRSIYTMKKKGLDLNAINATIMREYGLTSNQLSQLKRSAFSRWNLFLSDILQNEYDQIVGG